MIETPPGLRGRYYPDGLQQPCLDYDYDPATTRCRAFSGHRARCLACELSLSLLNRDPSSEDQDLVLMARMEQTTEKHRQQVAALEELTGEGMLSRRVGTVSRPSEPPTDPTNPAEFLN